MIYTLGYASSTPSDISHYAHKLGAIVVDVRLKPWSKDERFTKESLQNVLSHRYRHVGDFGNENYRGGPTKLKDVEAGMRIVRPLLKDGPIILLCACWKWSECHRKDVADMIRFKMDDPSMEVVHLPPRYAKYAAKHTQLNLGL